MFPERIQSVIRLKLLALASNRKFSLVMS